MLALQWKSISPGKADLISQLFHMCIIQAIIAVYNLQTTLLVTFIIEHRSVQDKRCKISIPLGRRLHPVVVLNRNFCGAFAFILCLSIHRRIFESHVGNSAWNETAVSWDSHLSGWLFRDKRWHDCRFRGYANMGSSFPWNCWQDLQGIVLMSKHLCDGVVILWAFALFSLTGIHTSIWVKL